MMELVKVLVFLLLTNVFCQEMDADTWSEEVKLFKLTSVSVLMPIIIIIIMIIGQHTVDPLVLEVDLTQQ